MARSRGVTIYGTYAVIVGAVNTAGNLGLLVLAPKLAPGTPVHAGGFLLGTVLGGLLLASGIGAFRLAPWGRLVALATAIVNAIFLLIGMARVPNAAQAQQIGYVVSSGLLFLLNGGLIWFFTRPAVKAQFQKA